VRAGFAAIATAAPERVVLLDGRLPVDELGRTIAARVLAHLGDERRPIG
jgi:thymidylate kinase